MLKVLIDMPVFEPVLRQLEQTPGVSVAVVAEPQEKVRPLPTSQIQDCEVLFCTFLPENHAEMKKLKLVQISSAGYSQLFGKSLVERGVRACNSLGVFDVPIAEWNLAMMINLLRDQRGLIRNQDAQIWDRSPRFQKEIRGSVVGIWGYGGIGRETARLAKALGMTVHVLVRQEIQKRGAVFCVPGTGDPDGTLPDRVFYSSEKEAFLNSLDFLVMAVPQTATTTGMVGETELRMLKPTAFVLNPARGPLIEETALIKALEEGWIAGAALDTHYYYPMPPEHPLWQFPNVIMTPHISGSSGSPRFLERVSTIFLENTLRFLNREVLLNELTVSQLSGN